MKIHVIDDFLSRRHETLLSDFNQMIERAGTFGLFYNVAEADHFGRKINWTIKTRQEAHFDPSVQVVESLWKQVSAKIPQKHALGRCYVNAHMYGSEDRIHQDDEDIPRGLTAIVYLNPTWKPEWNGPTAFYETASRDSNEIIQCVLPKYNRLLLFDKSIPHQVLPLSRRFTGIRLTLMFRVTLLED